MQILKNEFYTKTFTGELFQATKYGVDKTTGNILYRIHCVLDDKETAIDITVETLKEEYSYEWEMSNDNKEIQQIKK